MSATGTPQGAPIDFGAPGGGGDPAFLDLITFEGNPNTLPIKGFSRQSQAAFGPAQAGGLGIGPNMSYEIFRAPGVTAAITFSAPPVATPETATDFGTIAFSIDDLVDDNIGGHIIRVTNDDTGAVDCIGVVVLPAA